MTPTARTVLPTDLVALVSYDGRVYANEAMTLDRIGTGDSPHPLEAAFEQWFSFATGRHTWISVKGPTLRGLVSARKRGSKLAWEIDCLINAEEGDDGVLMSLLDQVTDAAGKSGAHKIFVRLNAAGGSVEGTTRCAFAPYRRDIEYRLAMSDAPVDGSLPEGLRRRTKADAQPVFQLYSATVPEEIRRYEASTLTEWSAAQEHLGRTAQYVIERDGNIRAWIRISGEGEIGRFELLAEHDALDDAIAAALAKLSNRESVFALVPDYQQPLRDRLERLGFEPGEEFIVLSRRTVRPVKAPAAVPAASQAVVRTTFG